MPDNSAMIRLAVAGAAGKMGSRIIALASSDERFQVVGALEMAGHPKLGKEAGVSNLSIADRIDTEFDVLIDFTLPAGTMHWLELCLRAQRPMVIGTTG